MLAASSVASVSARPPLLLFSVSVLSSAAGLSAQVATVVVHFLNTRDIDVAKLGATSGIDCFAQAPIWTRLESGETVRDGVRAWVRYEVDERVQDGETTVYVARAVESHVYREVAPGEAEDALLYHNRTWHNFGDHSSLGS